MNSRIVVFRAVRTLAATFLLSAGLTQCVSYDTEYKALAATAETNPSKDAIVGMWHRREDDGGNLAVDIRTRTSVLFKPDGTTVSTWQMIVDGVSETPADSKPTAGRWTYTGNGLWQWTFPSYPNMRPTQVRLSGGRLLVSGGQGGFTGNHVYERQE